MNQFARIISSVFQPLLMPVYSILLLFVYTHFKLLFANQFWTIMAPVILFSFVVPGILIYAVYKLKLISDLSLKIRKERFIPYSIVLVSYLVMIFYYYRIRMPGWFLMLVASSIAVILIAIFITMWWKISAHMFGIGGLLGGGNVGKLFHRKIQPLLPVHGAFRRGRIGWHIEIDIAETYFRAGCRRVLPRVHHFFSLRMDRDMKDFAVKKIYSIFTLQLKPLTFKK